MGEQRRLVAVLFADLVGSTSLSDGLDPEDTRALMAAYYQHALAIGEAHGGTLEKFIGDAVLMLFGTPRARRDDAERALRAALELRRVISEDPLLPGFRLRLGVHVGEVVTSETPTDVFIASGDAMNVAARLEQNAEAEQILVSARLAAVAAEAFEFGDEKELNVAGKAETLLVRELLGERSTRRALTTALAGREQEMMALRDAPQIPGATRTVLLTGAPGLGRTRLLNELVAEQQANDAIALEAAARGQQARAVDISWSLAQSLCQTEPTPGVLQDLLVNLGMDTSDAKNVAGPIAASAGLDHTVDTANLEVIIRAWRSMLLALSSRSDVLIAIDDCHVLPKDSWDLLGGLCRANLKRVTLYLTGRPDLLNEGDLPVLTSATVVALKPLTNDACRDIVRTVAPELHAADHIAQHANGNPFFLLELIKLGKRANFGTNSAAQQWPDSVRALITEQMDELTPTARELLLTLTVAGSALPVAYVHQTSDMQNADDLNLLSQLGFIREVGHNIEITQSMVSEIIYASISRADRVRRHVEIGLAMGKSDIPGIDISAAGEQLRMATVLAAQAAIPQRVSVPADLATTILRRAADAAWTRGAAAEARELIDVGLAMSATVEHRAMFFELRGDGLGWSPEAVGDFEALIDLASAQPDASDALLGAVLRGHRKAIIVLARGGQLMWMRRDAKSLIEHLTPALALAERLDNQKERALLLLATHFFPGELALSPKILQDRADLTAPSQIKVLRATLTPTEYSLALDALQQIADTEGRLADAVALAAERLELPSLPVLERVDALAMYQMALWSQGKFIEAVDAAKRIPHDPTRSALVTARVLSYSATFAYRQGLWNQLDELASDLLLALEEAIENNQDAGDCVNGYFALLWGALARGKDDEVAFYRSCLNRCLKSDAPWTRALQRVIRYGLGEPEDLANADPEEIGNSAMTLVTLCIERGVVAPEAILTQAASRQTNRGDELVIQAATALARGDDTSLARTAEELVDVGMLLLSRRIRRVATELSGDPVALGAVRQDLILAGDRYFAELVKLST